MINEFQDVNSSRVQSFDTFILIVAEYGFVHGREIDDGDGECAVHVENDATEARFGG